MTEYQPPNCDVHDYLEMACMRGYRLQVELADGSDFTAKAVSSRSADGEEFLVLQNETDQTADEQREVRLDQLAAITPLEAGAEFGRIELGGH